jgi:hypothetical protein
MLGDEGLMIPEDRMPPKLANEIKRLQLVVPKEWLAEVEAWRRRRPDPMPNTSEAIRHLVKLGLKADAVDKPKKKPKG